jgi:hypothetical protein
MDYILEIAKKRGIKRVYADFMRDNYIMMHMFMDRKFAIDKQEDVYHAELTL